MQLSALSFGAAAIGNLYVATDDDTAAAAVDAAWQGGIRYFDTAPHYGVGLSERRLGAALASRPRDEYTLSTKAGRLLVPSDGHGSDLAAGFDTPATHVRRWDYSRDGIRRSLDDSLDRLGLDRVDILYLHDPDEREHEALTVSLPALAELRAEGAVRAIGVGMNSSPMLTRMVRECDLDVVMVAGRYTLVDQRALVDLLPACEERGTSVVVAAVFNSGLLALPEPASDATFDYERAPTRLVDKAQRIADVCKRHGTTLPSAALHFPLAHPAVVSVTAGMRSPAEVSTNLDRFRDVPPPALWQALRTANLLPTEAPIPTT